MRHILTIGGVEHGVTLARSGDGYRLRVDGGPARSIHMATAFDGASHLMFNGRGEEVLVAVDGDRVQVHMAGATYELSYVDPVRNFANEGGQSEDDVALAPMPGTVIAVHVAAGDVVEKGQPLLVIESMKLETTIKAWRGGTVANLHVGKGEQFERQTALIALIPETGGV